VTGLIPVVEPASSSVLDLHDALMRSAEVYRSELETLADSDPRVAEVWARREEFLNEADELAEQHRILFAHAGLIDQSMNTSARSLYAQDKRFGVSDIGGCRSYVQRLIRNEAFTEPREDFLAAYVGTAVGDHLEKDYIRLRNEHARAQMEVVVPIEVVLDGEVFEIMLPGHPDIVEPLEHGNTVIDYKTKDGLGVVIREDGELKHKFQVTLYAKALIRAGIIDENATLALVYYDRAGKDQQPHAVQWTYDEAMYEEAVAWLADVIYAEHNGEEASRDMPRQWCESFCPFFTACRGEDTDVEGVIRDEHLLTTIALYEEAREAESAAKKLKESAAAELRGLGGKLPDGRSFRWVHVNETKIEGYVRRAYDTLNLPKKKVAK
jgi:hypothetical protein